MSQFMNEDQVQTSITYPELIRRLWPFSRGSRGRMVLALISVLALTLSSRFLPSVIGFAIDEGLVKQNSDALTQAALIFLFLEVIKTTASWSYLFYFQTFGNRILYNLREALMKHLQALPMDYFHRTPTGRIVTRATNDVANLGELFTEGVIKVFTESVALIAIVGTLFWLHWKLALITLVAAPIFTVLSFFLSQNVRRILRNSKKKLSQLNSFVAENLNGIKVVQLYNRVPRNRRKFNLLSLEYRDHLLESIRAYAYMQPVMNIFYAVTTTASLIGGAYFVSRGELAIGVMVAFVLNAQDFISPLREILEKYQQFQNSLTSGERVFQLFDEVREPSLNASSSRSEKTERKGQIELRDLSFSYRSDLPMVLKNISLKTQPGESIALVGRTGSGKSTMLALLQRLYNPPDGTLFIDGEDLNGIPLQELRQRVGVVLQDNFIFRGTIHENISLNDPRIAQEKVVEACHKIGFLSFLEKTGRHLNSWVEERGSNLSVGERQLIAFLRILAFEPEILILDEATANIDSMTETLIHKATLEMIKGRTSLIVAHRLSTVRECDRILVLHDGHIVESGSHQELVKANGRYARLVDSGLENIDQVAPLGSKVTEIIS